MNREERRRFAREHGVAMPPPDPKPTGATIQFAPLPVSTQVQAVEGPEGRLVLVAITSPQGVNGFFLPPDQARQFAGHLLQHATAAASGLEIVGDLGLGDEAPA